MALLLSVEEGQGACYQLIKLEQRVHGSLLLPLLTTVPSLSQYRLKPSDSMHGQLGFGALSPIGSRIVRTSTPAPAACQTLSRLSQCIGHYCFQFDCDTMGWSCLDAQFGCSRV